MGLNLVINGEARVFDGPLNVAGLVEELQLGGKRVAVEIDGVIVPRSQHAERSLSDGERVEIVHAIGGG